MLQTNNKQELCSSTSVPNLEVERSKKGRFFFFVIIVMIVIIVIIVIIIIIVIVITTNHHHYLMVVFTGVWDPPIMLELLFLNIDNLLGCPSPLTLHNAHYIDRDDDH